MTDSIYERKYHTQSLNDKNFLVTGGSGFIGSNITEYLLVNGAKKVRAILLSALLFLPLTCCRHQCLGLNENAYHISPMKNQEVVLPPVCCV